MLAILSDAPLNVTPNKLISTGPGAHLLTISGNDQSRVIAIEWQAEAEISGVRIAEGNGVGGEGYFGTGGGILVKGGNQQVSLTLRRCIVTENASLTNSGGGIQTFGNLRIEDSSIYNNSAQMLAGGGIGIQIRSTVQIVNSTVSHNTAQFAGGGIYN